MTRGRGQSRMGTEGGFILGSVSRSLATFGLHPEVLPSSFGSGLKRER